MMMRRSICILPYAAGQTTRRAPGSFQSRHETFLGLFRVFFTQGLHGGALVSVIPSPNPFLPEQYNEDRLLLLVRDPRTVFVAWELRSETVAGVSHSCPLSLRLFERTPGGGSILCNQVAVSATGSMYLVHDRPGSTFHAELGLGNDEHFTPLLTSRPVRTPTGRESDRIDSDWTTIDEVVERSRRGQYREGSSVFL